MKSSVTIDRDESGAPAPTEKETLSLRQPVVFQYREPRIFLLTQSIDF